MKCEMTLIPLVMPLVMPDGEAGIDKLWGDGANDELFGGGQLVRRIKRRRWQHDVSYGAANHSTECDLRRAA
jgi:hypothetical protein